MVKKYELKEVKRKSRSAWGSIPRKGCLSPKHRYEIARDQNVDAVEYIEEAIAHHRKKEQLEFYSQWQDLLCEASFGKGLAEGLLEMKNKTYKNRYRSFQELESVVRDLGRSYADLTSEPRYPENHLRVGNGFGRLGLAKEGKNMLEVGAYWDRIKDYLSNKQMADQ